MTALARLARDNQERGRYVRPELQFDVPVLALEVRLWIKGKVVVVRPGVEVQGFYSASQWAQAAAQILQVALTIKDVPTIRDCVVVRAAIELSRVNRNAARHQQAHGIPHEIKASFKAAQMLHGATAPREVEGVGRQAAKVAHIGGLETDALAESLFVAVVGIEKGFKAGGVLIGVSPSISNLPLMQVRRDNFNTASRQNGRQAFLADSKANASASGVQHTPLFKRLKDGAPLPNLPVTHVVCGRHRHLKSHGIRPSRIPRRQEVFVAANRRSQHKISPVHSGLRMARLGVAVNGITAKTPRVGAARNEQ